MSTTRCGAKFCYTADEIEQYSPGWIIRWKTAGKVLNIYLCEKCKFYHTKKSKIKPPPRPRGTAESTYSFGTIDDGLD